MDLRNLLTDDRPFALLRRRTPGRDHDTVEVLRGPVITCEHLADLPEGLALIPFRQIRERGFEVTDDGTPLAVLTPEETYEVPLAEALAALPDHEVRVAEGAFDVSDEEYARTVDRVLREEIGGGEGANFVIRRTYRGEIPGFGRADALALFRRLLVGERGAYWTFVVHTGGEDGRTLVGASPEVHVRMSGGRGGREAPSVEGGGGRRAGGEVTWYGGNFSAYEEALAVEQEAAERMVRVAESDLRKQKRELVDAQVKLARRKRYGQKMNDQKREPKIVMGARKRAAQVSAGKHRIMHEEKLSEAKERLDDAVEAVRDDDEIRVDLPYTAVPPGRTVLTLMDLTLRYGARVKGGFDLRGPERIALVGRNGAGKTTLLRTIGGELEPLGGEARAHVPLRFLPQRLDVLDDELSVAENVARFAPDATNNRVRARLARFLFKGAKADQRAATLSGGERFRAALAALLLAEPAPQLLMLDEPTNNLDMASVRQLSTALESYEGALIVASHDLPFLESIGITRWLLLDGELKEFGDLAAITEFIESTKGADAEEEVEEAAAEVVDSSRITA